MLHYHNHSRCQAAKALLAKPEHSISFVGREVGYISAAHFARAFKSICLRTPSAFAYSPKNSSSSMAHSA